MEQVFKLKNTFYYVLKSIRVAFLGLWCVMHGAIGTHYREFKLRIAVAFITVIS